MKLPIHSAATAAPAAQPIYDALGAACGFVPNVFAVYGKVPAAMGGFSGLTEAFGAGSLTPAEREVVQLAVSVTNCCQYCVAGHTAFASQAGLDEVHVSALRNGRDPADSRLAALARFARKLATDRGRNCTAEHAAFLAAGFAPEQTLEVIVGVANKALSNMTATLLNLPLDTAFERFAWGPLEDVA